MPALGGVWRVSDSCRVRVEGWGKGGGSAPGVGLVSWRPALLLEGTGAFWLGDVVPGTLESN